MSYLEFSNVSKIFTTPGGRSIKALNNLSFSMNKGQILAVVGHNGSGKTTLLNCLRNVFPFDGTITINEISAQSSSERIVSVYQDIESGVVNSMTALENLALVLSDRPGFSYSFPVYRFRKTITQFLEQSSLFDRFSGFADSRVSELSGGQRQQLAIAMALLSNPSILLLDEFVANLDSKMKHEILAWTKQWIQNNNVTAIMVTHDIEHAMQWCDVVLELCDGKATRFEPIR